MKAHYTIGFSSEEKEELLEIFKDNPKWKERIQDSFGFFIPSNFPSLIYDTTPENRIYASDILQNESQGYTPKE